MGANMMPTMKNMGRTVFGVRIGLRRQFPHASRYALEHVLPRLQPLLPKRSVYMSISILGSRAPRRPAYSGVFCSSSSLRRHRSADPGWISSRYVRPAVFAT
jgi:hypothetical protein